MGSRSGSKGEALRARARSTAHTHTEILGAVASGSIDSDGVAIISNRLDLPRELDAGKHNATEGNIQDVVHAVLVSDNVEILAGFAVDGPNSTGWFAAELVLCFNANIGVGAIGG